MSRRSARLPARAAAGYDANTVCESLLEPVDLANAMAQVKKPWVRETILAAARRLFRAQTYEATTLAQISREAGVSSANLYVYFESKLDLLYAVYEPWMRSRIMLLEEKLKSVESPFDGLRLLLRTLWKEIPAEENGFINNIVQALSTAGAHDKYNPSLLDWMEERINAMIFETLPPARRRVVYEARLAHMLVMALDGYAIHNHINPRGVADEQTIDAMARLLLGEAPVRSRRKP